MVTHQKCDKVADVDAFMKETGLKVTQVQIVYVTSKFNGHYMVFYDTADMKHD